jgi:hypothetical protein
MEISLHVKLSAETPKFLPLSPDDCNPSATSTMTIKSLMDVVD